MRHQDYPALFRNADLAAARRQSVYFRLLVVQYALLLVASGATVSIANVSPKVPAALYFACVVLAALLMLVASLRAPERDWYSARALAESIKTLTWRYVMHSAPFGTELDAQPKKEFNQYISQLMQTYKETSVALAAGMAHGKQITDEMQRIRALDFEGRKQFYVDFRIRDQLVWYQNKARRNRFSSLLCSYICIFVYGCGIAAAAWQFFAMDGAVQWLSEPILVLAAGLLGWMQAKRYSELATSYNLAAHEIAQIEDNISRIVAASELGTFVAEAEIAFSREHTQWIARQSSSVV